METFVNTELIEVGRTAARQLLKTGESRMMIPGIGDNTKTEFLVVRESTKGLLPIARFTEGGTDFMICADTQTEDDG